MVRLIGIGDRGISLSLEWLLRRAYLELGDAGRESGREKEKVIIRGFQLCVGCSGKTG